MEMKSTKINIMLVVALIFSVTCFYLMDVFVSTEEKANTGCSIVSIDIESFEYYLGYFEIVITCLVDG